MVIRFFPIIFFWSLLSAEVSDGVTLFTINDPEYRTYLIDNDQEIINTWQHSTSSASMPYLLPDSTLLFPGRVQDPEYMDVSSAGGRLIKYNWDGEIIWDYIFADSMYIQHHDIEPLPNGNVLLLAYERKSMQEGIDAGKTNLEGEIWSEMIIEVEPNDVNSGNIVWEWHFWDHLIQDVDPSKENYGIVSENPQKLDINATEVSGFHPVHGHYNGDWLHCNSVHYNQELDQIIISSRKLCELLVIDHSTSTEEASLDFGGDYGQGGDFLYRWGNPKNYDRGTILDKKLYHQHSVNWIPSGYPGEGNIILYNNGTPASGGPGNSSVIEISPPLDENNNYIINELQPFGPIDPAWSYSGSDDFTFYSGLQSGAFRLYNGNTFITICDGGVIFEVDSEGAIQWSFTASENVARSYKYENNYLIINIGDVNNDQIINILDVVLIVNIILSGDYQSNADINSDDAVDVLDIVQIINIILS